jgi:hypothetical protein
LTTLTTNTAAAATEKEVLQKEAMRKQEALIQTFESKPK